MDTTAEIHIPHWVSLSSRKGRSWCSISHLCSDPLWLTIRCRRGLGAMSLVLGIPGDNGLCSPRINIYLGAACTDGSGRAGQEGGPGEGSSRQNEHHGRSQWAGMCLGCIYPFADISSPLSSGPCSRPICRVGDQNEKWMR